MLFLGKSNVTTSSEAVKTKKKAIARTNNPDNTISEFFYHEK